MCKRKPSPVVHVLIPEDRTTSFVRHEDVVPYATRYSGFGHAEQGSAALIFASVAHSRRACAAVRLRGRGRAILLSSDRLADQLPVLIRRCRLAAEQTGDVL